MNSEFFPMEYHWKYHTSGQALFPEIVSQHNGLHASLFSLLCILLSFHNLSYCAFIFLIILTYFGESGREYELVDKKVVENLGGTGKGERYSQNILHGKK